MCDNVKSTKSITSFDQTKANKKSKHNILMRQANTSTPKFKNYELPSYSKSIDNKYVNSNLSPECMDEINKKLLRPDISERDPNISVKLETTDLWNEFSTIGTEMIITKCGRYVHVNN